MRRWWHAEHDWETTAAEADLRVGGVLRVLDFEETEGRTTVRFIHSGLWDEEAVRSHEDGWGKAFDNLKRALEASA
jgi:uncharacterized protein YndB with AHSA1/START domain